MRAVVVGSANLDLVLGVDRLPGPGATVLADPPRRHPGGKGANQAVALARLGADTTLVARLGNDAEGAALRAALAAEGVTVVPAEPTTDQPSGLAFICVDRAGESTVVVAPGANAHLQPADIPDLEGVDVVVLSLEIPMPSVVAAASAARAARALVVLNAAPAMLLPEGLMALTSCLVVNAEEATLLSSVKGDATEHALDLASRGPERVVVTDGPAGCVIVPGPGMDAVAVPAHAVTAVDAVGAGDCTTAALAVALAEPMPLADAARFAMAAAAIAVTRAGAQTAMPTRAEVEAFLVQP
jgi:ribokinase